jgi:hypothetical protein
MGLFNVSCSKCGKEFAWFSGNTSQICDACLAIPKETPREDEITDEEASRLAIKGLCLLILKHEAENEELRRKLEIAETALKRYTLSESDAR